MRYIIYGAGGIGSALGGMLVRSGKQAVLIARPAHAEAISRAGLIIETPQGELRIPIQTALNIDEIAPSDDDCILLTVKTQDTPAAINAIAEWTVKIGTEPPIVCLQNSICNEALALARFNRVIGGLVHLDASFLEPGRIVRTNWNTLALGLYPKGVGTIVKRIVKDLEAAGFNAHAHKQIMRAKWGKLIANLNNATNAITDTYLQRALSNQKHRNFMADVMDEGIAVADRTGVELDDGGIFDARAMAAALRHPPKEEAKWKLSDAGRSYPSTWQDLMLGRRQTETRFFNGEIVGLAASVGMFASYNGVLLETIERMSAAGEKPGKYSLDDLIEMVAARKRETKA